MLYSPPIFGIHSKYFITIFSWLYLLFNYRVFYRNINLVNLQKVYGVIIFFAIWSFFLVGFNDGTRAVIIRYIYCLFSIIPGALCISIHARKNGKDINYILQLVLWAALIQSVFSMMAFIDFDYKLQLLEKLDADGTMAMSQYENEIYYRLFGYSGGLTFDMPVVQAMIVAIAAYLSINKSSKYLLFVPTIIFSAFINARTSIVVMAVSIIILLWKESKFFKKHYWRLFISSFFIFISLVVGSSYLEEMSSGTYGWVMTGVEQLIGFMLENETKTGYFSYVADSDRWVIPKGLFLLIGTGERIMGGSSFGVYSDIGYINDLWFGGILYTLILYTLVLIFFIKLLKKSRYLENGKFVNFFCLSYLILLPILNFKTYIISLGGFSTLLIIILTHAFLTTKNNVATKR